MKHCAIMLAVAAFLTWTPGVAAAKSNTQLRGYAVLTGSGLSHPIVFSAPWDSSNGGFYSDEAEIFLNLATYSGAIPAGKDLIVGGGSVAVGVLPLQSTPTRDALGPRYRLTWFRDDQIDVAKQDIYPFAQGGPLVYTYPSSRLPLIALFGRFQEPTHLWTGWGRATPQNDLLGILQAKGFARSVPTAGAVNRVPRSGPGPWLALSSFVALSVLATGLFWFRRRRQKANALVGT